MEVNISSSLKNPLGFFKTFLTDERIKFHKERFFDKWEEAKLENDPDILIDRSEEFVIHYYDDNALGEKIYYKEELQKLLKREFYISINFIKEGIIDFPYDGKNSEAYLNHLLSELQSILSKQRKIIKRHIIFK